VKVLTKDHLVNVLLKKISKGYLDKDVWIHVIEFCLATPRVTSQQVLISFGDTS
jgi:hypothetical protein